MSSPIVNPWLEIVERDQEPRRLDLRGEVIRIGRARKCQVRVKARVVARLHAEILGHDGGFLIRDLGSKTGVFVNRMRTQEGRLAPGDVIEIGRPAAVSITFRGATSAAAGAAEPASMTNLARFFEFSRKLGGAFSLDEVLGDVVDLAIEVTDAERGMLCELKADGSIALRAARDKDGASLAIDGLKISETLVRQAVQARAPLVVPDVGKDPALAATTSIMTLDLRSAAILPLTRSADPAAAAGGEVFGALYLDSKHRRGRLAGLDLRLLERLAQDASAALDNARLLREAEDKRRMDKEVSMARDVQSMLMTNKFAASPAFAVAGLYLPCLELGGDYVDQFDLGNGRSALVVADVCGKGIAASLLAAALQGALVAEMATDRLLGEIVARVNRVHCRLATAGQFITMAVLVLEPDGTVRFVNAGHCPPLHVHGKGVAHLTTNGLALGLDQDATFDEGVVQLQRGEILVVYTDGIIECDDPDGELYGTPRFVQLLERLRGQPPQAVLDAIVADTSAFRRGTAVGDDFSAIVLQRV